MYKLTFTHLLFLFPVFPKVPVSPVQRRVTELRQFTQQLQAVHPNVFAKALFRSILYQDQDLVAISKPYGVPVYSKCLSINVSLTNE